MKLLSKRISQISKYLLLFNLILGSIGAQTKSEVLVSSDRYLLKIIDRTISYQDIVYQKRNLKALNCIFDDALVTQYFGKDFLTNLEKFIQKMPENDEEVRKYLHAHPELLKNLRHFFKMLRYSEDQKARVTRELTRLIRESARVNKCESEILYKDTLKTNFISLVQMELYLRSRYGGQLKSARSFDAVRPSIDLFVESLDKQFGHEYYW